MTENSLCISGDRDEAIVSYLYDDFDRGRAMRRSSTHLALCARCRASRAAARRARELGALEVAGRRQSSSSVMRPQSSADPARLDGASAESAGRRGVVARDAGVGAGRGGDAVPRRVGAALANLDIRYDRQGLSIRTGWSKPAGVRRQRGQRPSRLPRTACEVRRLPSPWRADLAALEQQLRTEFASARRRQRPCRSRRVAAVDDAMRSC